MVRSPARNWRRRANRTSTACSRVASMRSERCEARLRDLIVNISSRSGLVGIPGAAAYASSKAAVRNHTKTVPLDCAEQELPIRCNAVFPAAILTPLWEPMLGGARARRADTGDHARDPARPVRYRRRGGERGALARIGGVQLHHRRGADAGRRAPRRSRRAPFSVSPTRSRRSPQPARSMIRWRIRPAMVGL